MTDSKSADHTSSLLARYLRVADFVNVIKTGLILHDVEGNSIDLNAAAATMFGVGISGLAGAPLVASSWKPVHPDGSPMKPEEFPVSITLHTGTECRDVVLGFDVPDRSRLWLSIDTYRLFDEEKLVGVMSAFNDVTELYEGALLRETMMGVMKVVITSTDEAASLQNFCDTMLEYAHMGLVGIGFKSALDEGAFIEFPFVAGPPEFLTKASITWSGATDHGRGPAGTAMRTRTTQVCQDVMSDARLEPWRGLATETNLRSNVAIPFKVRDRDAVLVLYSNDTFAFPDVLVRGFEAIANELEFAVAHVKSVNDLAKALGATTTALSSVAEVRDPYTAGHQANVGELGFAIAQAMKLEPGLVDLVKKAGLLLDVGKVAVPLELLVRPGSLSAIEFDIVKQHTTLGEKILSDADLPWPLAEVAFQHHERVDGSGYPMGLAGGQISLPSRIIAVADVVDAMAHHRPYRAAYSIAEALSYVATNSGTLFDEDVVRACMSIFDAGFTFEYHAGP
jgi:HD-GYP domain-containing protein (c-di-GMP phosphodiesterase class II)